MTWRRPSGQRDKAADKRAFLEALPGRTVGDAAALQALTDIIHGNNGAAIGTLGAFINFVQAQSGNKITVADADALIADAQAIIDLSSG